MTAKTPRPDEPHRRIEQIKRLQQASELLDALPAQAELTRPPRRELRLEVVSDRPLELGPRRRDLEALVLEAASEEAFVELLRQILRASGRTLGRIASYSKGVLPRPTAYYFVKPGRRKMPTIREQVEAFATGAGLAPDQVLQVLGVWDALRKAAEEAKAQRATARAAAATPPAPTSSTQPTSLALALQDRVLEGVLVDETSIPAVRTGQDPVPSAGAEQVMPEDFTGVAGSVHTLVVHGGVTVHHEHNERHHAGHDRDVPGAGDGRDEPDAAASSPKPGLLAVALGNSEMFRRLMMLLAFAAVFLLGVAGMVIVGFSDLGVTFVLAPMVITVAAVVLLTRQAYGLRSGLSDVLRDSQPPEPRFRDGG